MTASVIRQKGESQNGYFKKNKARHVRVRIMGQEMFIFRKI